MKKRALAAVAGLCLAACLRPGFAQEYPFKPIRLVVPNSPGGVIVMPPVASVMP